MSDAGTHFSNVEREAVHPSEWPWTTAEQRQAAILAWTSELAPHGIFTTDTELRVQSWNSWLETHSGLGSGVVVGRPLQEIFPELLGRDLLKHFHAAVKGEGSVLSTVFHGYLLPFPSTDKTTGSQLMRQTVQIAPLRLRGESCGTITIIEDVTERETHVALLRRQIERDQLLSSILEKLVRASDPAAAVREILPLAGRHVEANFIINFLLSPETNGLVLHLVEGFPEPTPSRLVKMELGDLINGTCAATRKPIIIGKVQENTDPYSRLARELGMRSCACFPLLVGDRLIGTLGFGSKTKDQFSPDELEFLSRVSQYVAASYNRVLADAELNQAQDALRSYAGQLEVKVEERTERLRETIAQLESFSYTIAHDLRAPIRALTSYADIILEDHREQLPPEVVRYVDRMRVASKGMDLLTRDLLQFTRVSKDQIRLETVNLDEVVAELVTGSAALQTAGTLVVEAPLGRVIAQRTLVRHCLSNLLDNALKFVVPGIAPKIVIRTERRPSTTPPFASTSQREPFNPVQRGAFPEPEDSLPVARIWIEDNGIGIAPDQHHKIFGIFERGVSGVSFEGTGIGLAIVAKAIQRMRGSYGVESMPGQGSRFWLELPAA